MVMVLGHRSHTEAVLMQARAGDQWNLYEAKKIRQDSLLVVIDQMALQPTVDAKATALEFEREVERAERRAVRFDLGEALLQISVVLSSITLFTRRRSFFMGGLGLGVAGVAIAASAWLVR